MTLPGLFITGTDTAVGKTFIAAAIVRGLVAEGRRVGVLKPLASGGLPDDGDGLRFEDAERLRAALGDDPAPIAIERIAPLRFAAPLAPAVAARLEGVTLSFPDIVDRTRSALEWWEQRGVDLMIAEGVGGLLCPIADAATVADLAVALDYPLIVVARRGLGTLNHTLLTLEAARRRGLRIAGVVLNADGPDSNPLAEATNPVELARWLGTIPMLGVIPHHADPLTLPEAIADVCWWERARPPRLL